MNISALRKYIEDQDEISYPELNALLNLLTEEMNKEHSTMVEGLAVYNLRMKVNGMLRELKDSMSTQDIINEENLIQARRADLLHYTEMVKGI